MKKVFVFLVLFLFFYKLTGQAGLQLQYKLCVECPQGLQQNINYTYDTTQIYQAEDIESDYDMRITTGTKYHQGIDYKPRDVCYGDAVLSLEQGTVAFVKGSGNLKNIVIQNVNGDRAFVYMHIFRDAAPPLRSGNFMLLAVGGEYAILNMTETPAIAYARTSGLRVIYKRYANSTKNDTVYTTNQVHAGAMIAPIGDSGGIPVHLHVALIENPIAGDITGAFQGGREIDRSIDPWSEIAHPDRGFSQRLRTRKKNAFSLQVCEHTGPGADQWGQLNMVYSGSTRNTIEIEVEMANTTAAINDQSRYTNAAMDQEEVVLGIKRVGSDTIFKVARGSDFDSKFIINPVGQKTIYPSRMFDSNGQGGVYGSPIVNGISPFTYRDNAGFHPHDHYFISDFFLRLHKSDSLLPIKSNRLALYPWDACYRDGAYEMRSNVLDVDGNWYPMTNPVRFQIDNFAPFIYGMVARFSNGPGELGTDPIYSRYWEATGNGKISLGLRQSKAVPDPSNPGNLTLFATISEAMHTDSIVKARIPGPFPNWMEGIKVLTDGDGKEVWRFDMGASSTLVAETCYQVEFKGQDLAGNQLLNFELPAQCTTNTLIKTLPYRDSINSWANPHAVGLDKVHFIKLSPCGHQKGPDPSEKPCISLNEVAPYVHYATAGNVDGGIKLDISGDHPDAKFIWTDATGAEISNSPSLSGVPAGTYCLEILEYCCSISGCFEIGECQTELLNEFTHPVTDAPQSGEIDLTVAGGSDPVTYLWSTGATTEDLSGLSADTYCVTATDFFGCEMVDCITLVTCAPIEVAVSWNVGSPTGCGLNDGGIRILSRSASGGTAPYTYAMMNSEGLVLTPNQYGIFDNLAPDTYCLVATDANGCTGSICTELGLEYLAPAIESEVLPACVGQHNGSVTIGAYDSQLNLYNFTWDNNVDVEADLVSENLNLVSGTYCVTVSNNFNNCTYTECFEIPEVAPTESLHIKGATLANPCPDIANGIIDITVAGGVPPYVYHWTETVGAYAAEDPQNLLAGSYTVTVTDYCGATVVQSYTLSSLTYDLVAVPGCAKDGSMHVQNEAGGNEPYSYLWSYQYGMVEPQIKGLRAGPYCVTVSDSRGCSLVKCADLVNSEVIYEVEPSCEGMSNGSVILHINNPLNEAVNVVFNGASVYNNPSAPTTLSVPITNVGNGLIELMWDVGVCSSQASSTVHIPLEYIKHNYLDYTDGKCHYANSCKGEVIPNSFSESYPSVNVGDAAGTTFWNIWKTHCKVPLFCESVEVGERKFEFVKLRVGQYKKLIQYAGISPDYFQRLLFRLEGEDDCQWVRFCPATYEIFGIREDFYFEPETMTPYGQGCWTLKCGIFGDDNFCLSEIIEDVIPEDLLSGYSFLSGCEPGEATLAEFIAWLPIMGTLYPEFNSTPLEQFVLDNQNSPVAPCATIRFCWNDFSIIGELPDLSEIPPCEEFHIILNLDPDYEYEWVEPLSPIPGILLPIQINGCQPLPIIEGAGTNNCLLHVCSDPINILSYDQNGIPVYGQLVSSCSEPQSNGFAPTEDDMKLIVNPCNGQSFTGFGVAAFGELREPKGLINATDFSYYLDYTTKGYQDVHYQIPESIHFIDDWDNDHLVMVREIEENKQYKIEADASENAWFHVLTADQLTISMLDKIDSSYIVAGAFTGKLMLDNAMIHNAETSSAFILKMSSAGVVEAQSVLNNISSQNSPVFVHTGDGIRVSAVTGEVGATLLNGISTGSDTRSIITISSDGAVSEISDDLLRIGNGLSLVKTAFTKNGTVGAYLFKGIGRLSAANDHTISDNTKEEIILITTENHEVKWIEKIPSATVSINDLDIVYLSDHRLAIGLTFSDSIVLQGNMYKGKGDTDILLAAFNKNGLAEWVEVYGTSGSEKVMGLRSYNHRVYLGGEFGGAVSMRKIGQQTLLTFGNCPANPYITYLSESSIVPNIAAERVNYTPKNKVEEVKVYPNPATKSFVISVPDSFSTSEITVYDVMSNVLIKKEGKGEIVINSAQLPPGIYSVYVFSKDNPDAIPTRINIIIQEK